MPNQNVSLDRVFHALADTTRRKVVERLGAGAELSATELARRFDMTLPSFTQHLSVLEDCGLVRSKKTGRVRSYRLVPEKLRTAEHWLERQRTEWNQRLDQLDSLLNILKEQQ